MEHQLKICEEVQEFRAVHSLDSQKSFMSVWGREGGIKVLPNELWWGWVSNFHKKAL